MLSVPIGMRALLCLLFVSGLAVGDTPTKIAVPLDAGHPWIAQPTWLENPSNLASVEFSQNTIRLSIGQLGAGMKWLRMLEAPIATATTPWVSVRYRASHRQVSNGPLLQLGDGTGIWQPVLSLDQLHDDGAWHTLTARTTPMTVRQLVLQYQADRANGSIEIGDLHFSGQQPRWTLSQVLAWNPATRLPPAQNFQPLLLRANKPAVQWLDAAGLANEWFRQQQVTASGVPFTVSTDTSAAIVMTSLPDVESICVPVGKSAEAVYLLMGAVFSGNESSAIGYGKRTQTQQPEHLSLRVVYADGCVEPHFPGRLPSMKGLIARDPGAYVIHPGRNAVIDHIELIDQVRSGALAVAGITLGPRFAPPPQQFNKQAATQSIRRRPLEFRHTRITTDTVALDMDVPSGMLHALVHRHLNCQWLAQPTPLYRLADDTKSIQAQVTGKPLATGDVEVQLTLTNISSDPVAVQPTFPLLKHLNPGTASEQLGYVFPRQAAVIGCEPAALQASYGASFPVQFMAAYDGASGGLYLCTHDLTSTQKLYRLNKTDTIEMGVQYSRRTLAPGETWTLPPAVIGAFQGTWWEAVRAYQRWVATWYRARAPRPAWFREAFNFRQQFLNQKLPEASGMFDPQTKTFALEKVLAADAEAFGGVDMLHLFDWGSSPTHGRVGDYQPWDLLGPPETFRQAIDRVQNAGTPVGLYLEGYLTSYPSRVSQTHGKAWRSLAPDGKPYSPYGDSDVMCANEPPWQDYLASTLGRVSKQSGARGYYVDQFGFGSQYPCYSEDHAHPVPGNQLVGEQECLRRIRAQLPPESVIYTEELPIDVTTQFQEGAFSYAVRNVRLQNTPGQINLARFIWPEFKTFEILTVDAPVSDDLHGIKLIFFNGEGIWLEGTPPQAWFSPEALATIRRTYAILHQHRKAFTGLHPRPLVPTLNEDVCANQFPAAHETVWTFLNTTSQPMDGEMIAVEHVPGATYTDAWLNKPISPRLDSGKAYLSFPLGPRDVGCVVQRRP